MERMQEKEPYKMHKIVVFIRVNDTHIKRIFLPKKQRSGTMKYA